MTTVAAVGSPEARRRAQTLLEQMSQWEPTADEWREIRAIEVLERIATPAARALLADLAKGDPAARLTQEAKGSLGRLK